MSRDKRKFSPQFKAEAVQFVIETGRPIAVKRHGFPAAANWAALIVVAA